MNNRQTAINWFSFKSDTYKQVLTDKHFHNRNWGSLTGREIEQIYFKEN